jgi:hypothetical protein
VTRLALAALMSLITAGGPTMPDTGQIKLLDTIRGANYLTVQAALKVLDRHAPDLSRYTVLVVREAERASVILADNAADPALRKNLGVRQGASEALSARDVGQILASLDRIEVLEKLQGTSLRAIRAAEPTFRQRLPNSDLAEYQIEVVRDGESLVVLFTGKDREPGTRGHIPARPGLEVELDSGDLRVIRSAFIR